MYLLWLAAEKSIVLFGLSQNQQISGSHFKNLLNDSILATSGS